MNLADALRDALRDARQRCGGMIAVTLDGLGYVAVPVGFVDVMIKLFEKDDERRAVLDTALPHKRSVPTKEDT